MSEIQSNNPELNQEKASFKKLLAKYLADKRLEPEEAMDLLKKFDLEKREIISFTDDEKRDLMEDFWEEITIDNFNNQLEKRANYFLNTQKPDKNLIYKWLGIFTQYKNSDNFSIDLKNPQKPENISEENLSKAIELLELAKKLKINDWKISFTKDYWVVLELGITWSNLFIKLEWENVIVTWQNAWKLFVENLKKEDFMNFVRNYDKAESKRVLEDLWFTWWMTLTWILSFTIKTWIWILLWLFWTWLWVLKWYRIYKNFNLSSNEALDVLKENKDNIEWIKNYLYLSQVWYITSYNSPYFETIDWEKLTIDNLRNKENIDVEKYSLIRWLQEKWYNPKFIYEWKYELDMYWLWDDSKLVFNWKNIEFSTDKYENWKKINFSNVKEAFEKIQKINEYLKISNEINVQNNNQFLVYNSNFQNDTSLLEKKLNKLKKEIE